MCKKRRMQENSYTTVTTVKPSSSNVSTNPYRSNVIVIDIKSMVVRNKFSQNLQNLPPHDLDESLGGSKKKINENCL